MTDRRWNNRIPKGFRLFHREFDVAGTHAHGKAIEGLQHIEDVTVELVAEPANKHDKNAIKIVFMAASSFGKVARHVGYVPKEVAKDIADNGILDKLKARPKYIWIGDRGGITLTIDILGPKEAYENYTSEFFRP